MTPFFILAGIIILLLIIRATIDKSKYDQMRKGYGEFGLELTNPIPVSSVRESYLYLNRLRTKNGSQIYYKRIGSMEAPNIKPIIDAYQIFTESHEIGTIYICPYNKKTSKKAPKGFMLTS